MSNITDIANTTTDEVSSSEASIKPVKQRLLMNQNTNKMYIDFLISDNKLKYDNLKNKQLIEEKAVEEAYDKTRKEDVLLKKIDIQKYGLKYSLALRQIDYPMDIKKYAIDEWHDTPFDIAKKNYEVRQLKRGLRSLRIKVDNLEDRYDKLLLHHQKVRNEALDCLKRKHDKDVAKMLKQQKKELEQLYLF
jgi:hypothetical protein